jgi:hypothetical protein
MHIALPAEDGRLVPYQLAPRQTFQPVSGPFNRTVYSAAHVVADPLAQVNPWIEAAIDWDATMAYRRHLWSLGLGVAEAMDTAQRGMGLDWPRSLELIERSVAEARATPGALIGCGAGTDHLPDGPATIDAIIAAYEMQCEAVERCGGTIILMASRALAATARGPDDYRRVYGRVLSQIKGRAILHWLGDMFDPKLAGYWGTDTLEQAEDICVGIIEDNAAKIDGIKISLLDSEKELSLRRRLPSGLKMYTGDDFNYPELIAGDDEGHSHALLGIFDAIAPAASAALACLTRGDRESYDAILTPTLPLSRHIFQAPTRFYKTGVVFMAYLNGHQNHFTMIGGQQSARSLLHLGELFRLADQASLLLDPDMACARMQAVLAVHGLA